MFISFIWGNDLLKSKDVKLVGLITVFVLIIAVSGCTSTSNVKNQTFSKGGITFQYPETWSNNVTFSYTTPPNSNETVLGNIGDDTISVSVIVANLTNSGNSSYSIETIADIQRASFNAGEILSSNVSTYNNITFYEMIYTSEDGVTGETYKGYKLLFGEQGDKLYTILFKTKEDDFQNSYQQMKEIQSSIKYT